MVKQILNNPIVRGLWIAFLLIIALAVNFGLYAYWEHQVDKANARLNQSNALANELLKASETSTRLARTYAITGDKNFLAAYQQVIDSKNGRLAVPLDADLYYWNPSIELRARLSTKKAPLQDRIRTLEVRQADVDFLNRARRLSDALAETETEVFAKIAAVKHDFSLSHLPAMDQLFDASYRRDKALVLWNIQQFNERITAHEEQNVQKALSRATQL